MRSKIIKSKNKKRFIEITGFDCLDTDIEMIRWLRRGDHVEEFVAYDVEGELYDKDARSQLLAIRLVDEPNYVTKALKKDANDSKAVVSSFRMDLPLHLDIQASTGGVWKLVVDVCYIASNMEKTNDFKLSLEFNINSTNWHYFLKKDLYKFIVSKDSVDYLSFWGHQKSKKGISKSCFSQWYESNFLVDGVIYPTAEHYMMAKKAEMFGDRETYRKILMAKTPKEAKELGRSISGFIEEVWVKNRFQIVVDANLAKFSQNEEIKNFLLDTGDSVLVEASPVDEVWGIGLAADHPDVNAPDKWPGLNLLGFALMHVRSELT